jgi:hypothetical protein
MVGPSGSVTGVALYDGLTFVSCWDQGILIYDTGLGSSDPLGIYDDNFVPTSIAVGNRAAVAGGDMVTSTAVLKLVNLTNPAAPWVEGTYTTGVVPTFNDVALNSTGTVAVVTLGMAGLWTMDLGNPADPDHVGSLDTAGKAMGVAVSGTKAYVADSGNGIVVVDISVPSAPQVLGSKAIPYRSARDVAVAGTLAYVADQTGMLYIFDVSNPSNPVLKNPYGLSLAGSAGYYIAAEGNWKKVAVISGTATGDYLQIIDVTSASAPVVQGTVMVGPSGSVTGVVFGSEGRVYLSAKEEGLKIYDISSPETPTLEGTVATVGDAEGVALQGDIAYVADFPATIDIINLQ